MNERQKLKITGLSASKAISMKAEGYLDTVPVLVSGDSDDWRNSVLALEAYSSGDVEVRLPHGTSLVTDPVTGEDTYNVTVVIEYIGIFSGRNMPQISLIAGEHQKLSVNGASSGSLNGVAISAGQSQATIQSNLRGSGGNWSSVVSKGTLV